MGLRDACATTPGLGLWVAFWIKQACPGPLLTRFWTGVCTGAREVAGSRSVIQPASCSLSTHTHCVHTPGRPWAAQSQGAGTVCRCVQR